MHILCIKLIILPLKIIRIHTHVNSFFIKRKLIIILLTQVLIKKYEDPVPKSPENILNLKLYK